MEAYYHIEIPLLHSIDREMLELMFMIIHLTPISNMSKNIVKR